MKLSKAAQQEGIDYELAEVIKRIDFLTGTRPTVEDFTRALSSVKKSRKGSRKRGRTPSRRR